jgi:hypothetical protein
MAGVAGRTKTTPLPLSSPIESGRHQRRASLTKQDEARWRPRGDYLRRLARAHRGRELAGEGCAVVVAEASALVRPDRSPSGDLCYRRRTTHIAARYPLNPRRICSSREDLRMPAFYFGQAQVKRNLGWLAGSRRRRRQQARGAGRDRGHRELAAAQDGRAGRSPHDSWQPVRGGGAGSKASGLSDGGLAADHQKRVLCPLVALSAERRPCRQRLQRREGRPGR